MSPATIVIHDLEGSSLRPDDSGSAARLVERGIAAIDASASVLSLTLADDEASANLHAPVLSAWRAHAPHVILAVDFPVRRGALPEHAIMPGRSAFVDMLLRLRPDIVHLDLSAEAIGNELGPRMAATRHRLLALEELGILPEFGVDDSFAIHRAYRGICACTFPGRAMFRIWTERPGGFASTAESLLEARGLLPLGAAFSAVGGGRQPRPLHLLGGMLRVGRHAAGTIADAAAMIKAAGGRIASCREARQRLLFADGAGAASDTAHIVS